MIADELAAAAARCAATGQAARVFSECTVNPLDKTQIIIYLWAIRTMEERVRILGVLTASLAFMGWRSPPPRIAVHVVSDGMGAVRVAVLSNGATVDAPGRRLVARGDTLTLATPIAFTAELLGDGLTVSSPANDQWIRVEVGKPGEPPMITSTAAAVQISYANGRVWARGTARSGVEKRGGDVTF